MPAPIASALASALPPFSLAPFLAIVLSQTQAIIATIIVLLVVIIAWKFLKLAFRIALIIVAAVAIYFALQWAGIL